MTRTMYDSVVPGNCPASGDAYAGYLDGRYANLGGFQARFPGKRLISITVWNSLDAEVIDCETGDATPLMVPDWTRGRRARNLPATCYCNLSTWPQVQQACYNAGVALPDWWAAGYRNPPTPYFPPGAVACQWLGDYHGYDQSILGDSAFPLATTQPPPIVPQPPIIQTGQPQGDKMLPHYVHVPTLDANGNGAVDLAGVAKGAVVSILENGFDPISNRRYAKQATFAPLAIGATATRVVIQGGDPGTGIDFTVWTTS